MKNKAIILILTVGLLGFFPAQHPAYACSGGGVEVSLDAAVESADVIVDATIYETDDAAKNLILEVSHYLKGSGPQYILLYRTNPALSATYNGRHYDTGCLYGGASPWPTGMRGYFPLIRLANGAYTFSEGGDVYGFWVGENAFPQSFYTKIDPAGPDSPENWDTLKIGTDEEFIAWVLAKTESTLTRPESATPPRRTPLLITTETGNQYVLPIDGGEVTPVPYLIPPNGFSPIAYPDILQTPPLCIHDNPNCTHQTPDRSLRAWFSEVPDTILVDYYPYYLMEQHDQSDDAVPMPMVVTGQAFAFSSTGEALVVWNDGTLHIFWVNNEYCNCMYGEFAPRLDEIATIALAGGEAAPMVVRWSADGTTMAYYDKAGVWVFDVFRMEKPELLVAGSGLRPLFLSTSGRYVAYQNPTTTAESRRADVEWTVLDRVTGVKFANAIVSPDERHMAHIAPAVPVESPNGETCTAPFMTDCPLVLDYVPQRFEWTADPAVYYDVRCSSNGMCDLRSDRVDGLTISMAEYQELPDTSGQISDVAYESTQGLYAVAVGGTNILLLTPEPITGDLEDQLIELSDSLDGKIVDVAWLPSLFYEE